MPFIETELWLAIKARIDTLVLNPVMPVIEPGATFTAPSDAIGLAPYVLTSDVRNDVERMGIDTDLQVHSGTLMLAIQWPISRPATHAQLFQMGGAIAAHFPADLRMRFGSACIRVTEDPTVSQPYREDANMVIRTRIRWSTL